MPRRTAVAQVRPISPGRVLPGRLLPLSDGLPMRTGTEYRDRASDRQGWVQMTKDELIIQLVKVALGILIGGYFLWWSLEVLKRLPPPH